MRSSRPGSRITKGAGSAPSRQSDIAIIGMSCLFPGAPNLAAFWQNIVSGFDATTDPPDDAWSATTFFDPGSAETDRVYCKRGGYLGPLARLNPLEHGVMPLAVQGGEPEQWLALQLAHDALSDAGYQGRPREWQRTAVIIGKSNYVNRSALGLVQHGLMVEQAIQVLRRFHDYSEDDLAAIRQDLTRALPPLTADTASSYVPNVIAGRIANRLDLMGPSYTVDAACASSLLAVQIAARYLATEQCDLALVGGVQVAASIPTLTLFAQLNALSRRQQLRAFDAQADGMVLGEGIGMVVLKRHADARRDGDRIYAVIKGVGVASDGAGSSVLVPAVESAAHALRHAYDMAAISPRSVELIEAHGAGIAATDQAEILALQEVFGPPATALPRCGVGTVKTMIGHTLPAAGIAGLIKAALALYHRTLPPTLHCDRPNPALELERTPFYINTQTRPWIHGALDTPRRAGVNAFGLGGITAHVVLEEAAGQEARAQSGGQCRWDSEVCIVRAESRDLLRQRVDRLVSFLAAHGARDLTDVAYTLNTGGAAGAWRLALVAVSLDDLRQKLEQARQRLADPECDGIKDVRGIYFTAQPLSPHGRLAFLFPGEGAQYGNMLADLCLHFPEVRACFDQIDRVYLNHPRGFLPSDVIFPRPCFGREEQAAALRRLWQMDTAMEAVLTANHALHMLLTRLGIRPDVVMGHSTGEFAALRAAGILNLDDEATYKRFLLALNRSYEQESRRKGVPCAALMAIGAERAQVQEIVTHSGEGIYIAMDNCRHQTIVAGHEQAVLRAAELARARGIICTLLPYDRAYHTPLFKVYADKFARIYAELPLRAPTVDIYSCTTMQPFPRDPAAIRRLALLEQWVRPVEFRGAIEALYRAGVRLFVEVGPKGNLTAFIDDILSERAYVAVPANVSRRSGVTGLHHMLALLAAHGVPMNLEYLYERRSPRRLALDDASAETAPEPARPLWPLPTDWSLHGLSPELTARLRRGPGATPAASDMALPADPATTEHMAPDAPVAPPDGEDATREPESCSSPLPPVHRDMPVASAPPTTYADMPEAVATLATMPSPAAPALTPHAVAAVHASLRTMDAFITVQEEIMGTYLWVMSQRRMQPCRDGDNAGESLEHHARG